MKTTKTIFLFFSLPSIPMEINLLTRNSSNSYSDVLVLLKNSLNKPVVLLIDFLNEPWYLDFSSKFPLIHEESAIDGKISES